MHDLFHRGLEVGQFLLESLQFSQLLLHNLGGRC